MWRDLATVHGTKIEYMFHQTLFLYAIKRLGTRLNIAIYFSETSNFCPVRVLNHEMWHRYRCMASNTDKIGKLKYMGKLQSDIIVVKLKYVVKIVADNNICSKPNIWSNFI